MQAVAGAALTLPMVALAAVVLPEGEMAVLETVEAAQPLITVLVAVGAVTNQVVALVRAAQVMLVLWLLGGGSNNAVFCKGS